MVHVFRNSQILEFILRNLLIPISHIISALNTSNTQLELTGENSVDLLLGESNYASASEEILSISANKEGIHSILSSIFSSIDSAENDSEWKMLFFCQIFRSFYQNPSTYFDMLMQARLCPPSLLKKQKLLVHLLGEGEPSTNSNQVYDVDHQIIHIILSCMIRGISSFQFSLITIQAGFLFILDLIQSSKKNAISKDLISNMEQVCKELKFLTEQYRNVVGNVEDQPLSLHKNVISMSEFWGNFVSIDGAVKSLSREYENLVKIPKTVEEIYFYRKNALNLFREFLQSIQE
jgi:hypothetical protein